MIGSLMVATLALLVVLQSSNVWKSFDIDSSTDLFLLYGLSSLNFAAFIVFAFIFLRSIVKLMRERRTLELGAQIKTRLLVYFFAISLLPILAMAAFSYLFMNRALERWFSQIPQHVVQQARNMDQAAIDEALGELDRLGEEQGTIRRIGLLTLGTLTFLLMFASMWIAFYVARGLTTPIKALAEGADEIARGNLSHRVEVMAEDELALLVASFNEMSAKLESTSVELGERRKYIETVLETLPTGVISFDADGRVSTINRSAAMILKLDGEVSTRPTVEDLLSDDNLAVVQRLVARAKRVGRASDQTILNGDGDEHTVALTATKLLSDGGIVLVLEDLSELIAAQRASAWQEVARRMAHEIKNPLTPIQLSAERIAKRFGSNGEERRSVGAVVDESTATILREVTSLKTMVDEFARFARLPDIDLQHGDLNAIIAQSVVLYDGQFDDISIRVDGAKDLPEVLLDGEQMKRVFVNLIENSVEAFDGIEGKREIIIATRYDAARDLVIAEVADNAKGIAPRDLQQLFQPYFSTKGRGTGLGLAIVSRIIAEHDGKIKVVANPPRGAKFIIELPAAG